MSYKLNIKKTEKDGWRITSKLSYGIGVIYFTSEGEYLSHWPLEETTIEAKYYTVDDSEIGVFYCKEDAEEVLEDNTLYYVFEENNRFNYLSIKDQILWNLPTREEALDNFIKDLDKEDIEFINDRMESYHGNLSYACFDYCLEHDIPYGDCISVHYIPPVTLKNKKQETPITRETIKNGLIDHKILNPRITREV